MSLFKLLKCHEQIKITSNLLFNFNNPENSLGTSRYLFAVYDEERFEQYIKERMNGILEDLVLIKDSK